MISEDARTSKVCDSCPARCCSRVFNYPLVGLTAAEADSPVFRKHRARHPGTTRWFIPFGRRGCPYLKLGRCSIYGNRPEECRMYLCFDNPDAAVWLSYQACGEEHKRFLESHGLELHDRYDPNPSKEAVKSYRSRRKEVDAALRQVTRLDLSACEKAEKWPTNSHQPSYETNQIQ